MSEKKSVNQLVLSRREALARYLVAKQNDESFNFSDRNSRDNAEFFKEADEILGDVEVLEISDETIQGILLNVDHIALNASEFPEIRLTDQSLGHWELYSKEKQEEKESVSFGWKKEFYQRDPSRDIVESGFVAIDFGTKNTVAGFIDANSKKRLIRIGTANTNRAEAKNDYENPTVMQFVDLQSFWDAYCSSKGRPLTNWCDLLVSHEAQNRFKDDEGKEFYSFFGRLKQWANNDREKILIEDVRGNKKTLEPLVDYEEGEINPIEIYAYYIGRYINTMEKGIYLQYLLSYPVEYSKVAKEKIRASFERGIRRSIPSSIFDGDHAKKFRVELTTTEPAAYALTALKAYGFEKDDCKKENTYFGVFDFGGGTTDFDFGVWKASERKDRYVWDIHHFGGDGDVYLGGENLLEMLAYEIFKENHKLMLKENCPFPYAKGCEEFGGCESVVSETQIARRNMTTLIERYLREFWEQYDKFDTNANESEAMRKLRSGTIDVFLTRNDNTDTTLEFEVSSDRLGSMLKEKISLGVSKFFGAFENIFGKKKKDIKEDLKVLHIFLGGNSSRSPLVKEAFDNHIAEKRAKHPELDFTLYPPLGTPEAQEKIEELGVRKNETDQGDISKGINCKTGVVFGLLDGRKTGEVRVINDIKPDAEAKFRFHLGRSWDKKFQTIINRNDVEADESPRSFLPYADVSMFELYYTDDPRATSNELDIETVGIKRLPCYLDRMYEEEDRIDIEILSINTIRFFVFSGDKKCFTSEVIRLGD